MSRTGDPSQPSPALAIQLGVAKEGEPMTPLMSMLTKMKEYAEYIDIGADKGTQASWASCIPQAEKLLELEREVLDKLREKAAEWDSRLSSRTGELAELEARLESMTRETARANEELLHATRKQSDATKQLRVTLEDTRIAQENHAKDEQRLKQKEDLLTIHSDDLEKQKASAANKEACLKHRSEELEARESKMAATERLARDSDTQAKRHLDAIRNAHSTLWVLTERTGDPITGLSAHELVVDLQGLTSDFQNQIANLNDQIAQLNDSRTKAEGEEAKARQISNRELKTLRDDVVARASTIKKAELCAADYKSKYESLQTTSSERIQELELSNQNLLITTSSLEGRLSEALQHHTAMATEYAKYEALERTEKALNNQIQYIEGRLHTVERQRNDAIAANRTFEIENARLQKFQHAHRLNEEEIGQYIRDRDRVVSDLQAEVEAYKTEARRLEKDCEDLRSQGVTNAKNVATDIERVQGASNAKILDLEETIKRQEDVISRIVKASDTKILGLERTVKHQEEQLNDAEKLAKEREDRLRKADDLNTSLYQKIKDGALARDSAIKCRIEHQNFDELKRRSSELEAQVAASNRARKEERDANSQLIKALRSQRTASQTEVNRLDGVISEDRASYSRTIKALEGRITLFGNQVKELESEKVEDRKTNSQTIKALEGRIAQLGNQVKDLESEKAGDNETNAQTIKALEGRIALFGNQVKELESEKAEDRETNTQAMEALKSRNADSQMEVQRLSRIISEYKETNSETIKGLEGQFARFNTKIMELESEKAEAAERATNTDRTLRTYHDTIKRLRGERDQALQEITLANATHATALDDARQARHELESMQQRVTHDNSNEQRATTQPRRKRRAEEMLEEDRPTVPAVGHVYDLQEIRDPKFTDPNIPSEVLDKIRGQFDRWDKKSGQEWARQITKSRCVEARQAKVSAQQLHGGEHACNYCEDRGRICVVVRQAGIITLLPVHQDGDAVAPEEESYWVK